MVKMNVKVTLTEPALGTSPNNENLYRDFIASKAPDLETVEEEVSAVAKSKDDNADDKGMTVFPRSDSGEPMFWDYQIRGFFKDACSMLSRAGGKDETGKKKAVNESSKMKAYKKNIDGLIFVLPRQIPIDTTGTIGLCQRPLRATTMQGERVTLAMSEEVPAGSSIKFTVLCPNEEMMKAVREWLDYGYVRGLGQWRNSGKGKFTWEELDDAGEVIPGSGNGSLAEADALMRVAI